MNRWLAGLAVLASAVAYLGTFMVYMPHVRFEVNSGKCGLGASYLFATIGKPFPQALLSNHNFNR